MPPRGRRSARPAERSWSRACCRRSGSGSAPSSLDELQHEARRSPEARNPGWELSGGELGYAARGPAGWHLLRYAALALLWLTGYRLARLFLRPWASVWLVIGMTAFVLVWLVVRALGRSE